MNTDNSSSDSKSCIDIDDEIARVPLLQTNSRVSISKPHSHTSLRKLHRKTAKATSLGLECIINWEDEIIKILEEESRYLSQNSLEPSYLDDSGNTSDEYDSSEGQSFRKCSSTTSDTYDSSDDDSDVEEFFDSSSCSIHDDTDLDQSIQPKSINCNCPSATTNTSSPKSTTEIEHLARSKEQKSGDTSNFWRESDYFCRNDFTNIAETDSSTATTRNGNGNFKTATNTDRDNPANFLADQQCLIRLDILLRLKDILLEIISDCKKNGSDVYADAEQRIRQIIEENENLLKEQAPPEILEKIQDQISNSKPDELDSQTSTSQEISRIPASALSNWNYDDEQGTDSDSTDTCDDSPIHHSEDFKKYFDKYQPFIARVKESGKKKPRSWKDEISCQQRKNWAESIAYTAATQVEAKPGKRIDQDGLKRFGECIEWEVFHCRANSAVEYSNTLCDIHSEIGHGRMSESEREYLMFLAYKN